MHGKGMDNAVITIGTVNYNTSDFIEVLLYALETLTFNPYRVIICDNGSCPKQLIKLKDLARGYKNVIANKGPARTLVNKGRRSHISIGFRNSRELSRIQEVLPPYAAHPRGRRLPRRLQQQFLKNMVLR